MSNTNSLLRKKNEEQHGLTVKDYRKLYEGLTQRDSSFRNAVMELNPVIRDMPLPSALERVQNRLNYAMLGAQLQQPQSIPCPEIEVSGVVHFDTNELCLYSPQGEQYYHFDALDPNYVAFLREQRPLDGSDELILSSIALRTSHMLLEEQMQVPSLEGTYMNIPEEITTTSRRVLERAFSNSMVLMNHLQHEMEKFGLDKTYGIHKDDLLQHVSSNMFDAEFEHSISDLKEDAKDMVTDHEL